MKRVANAGGTLYIGRAIEFASGLSVSCVGAGIASGLGSGRFGFICVGTPARSFIGHAFVFASGLAWRRG